MDTDLNLPEVIEASTKDRTFDSDKYDERFFEVELDQVVRLRSDILLNEDLIREYISEVGPVPFHPRFKGGQSIVSLLGEQVHLGNLSVFLNGSEEPVVRPHRDLMELADGRQLMLNDVERIELLGINGEPAAVGWVAHHDYQGAVPTPMGVKGVRIRSGNIQVGSSNLLEDLFVETRFNSWTIAELHVIDQRLIPNARRDDFEQNAHMLNLTNQFLPYARRISSLCRTSSIRRNWIKRFESAERDANDRLAVLRQGAVGDDGRTYQLRALRQAVDEMLRVEASSYLENEEREDFARRRRVVEEYINETTDCANPSNENVLARMAPAERENYEHFFTLVYECSPNCVLAKSLVDRILERLTEERSKP